MTIADFLRLSRVNAKLIFVMASVGLLIAFLYTFRQPVLYTATSVGVVTVTSTGATAGEEQSNLAAALSQSPIYADNVTSARVAEAVRKKLNSDLSAGEIAGRFSAVADAVIPKVTITAVGSSPAEAKALADAVVVAASDEVDRLRSEALPEGADPSSPIRMLPQFQATAPEQPSSPNYRKNLLAGGLAGIIAGFALALVRRQLDSRIRSVDDIEGLVGSAVLSIIPESRELDRIVDDGLVQSQTGPAAEALRQLRTNLRFVDVDNPPRSIVISSANAGEGKSVVTANLARVLAAAGQRTVLIDADLRRPMVDKLFDLDPAVGLTQVLAGDVTVEQAIQDPGLANMRVITSGRIPPNPSELLGSQKMQHLIQDLTEAGYLVLIDAPPLLPVTDAGLLSGTVDGTILVLSVGGTYKEQAKLAVKILNQVGGHVLGTVLNRAPLKGIGSVVYGYGYSGYSQDYYSAYVYRGGQRSRGDRRQEKRQEKQEAKQATRKQAREQTQRVADRTPDEVAPALPAVSVTPRISTLARTEQSPPDSPANSPAEEPADFSESPADPLPVSLPEPQSVSLPGARPAPGGGRRIAAAPVSDRTPPRPDDVTPVAGKRRAG